MIEIKISGRGGQGVVLASQILGAALFKTGMWIQAFPSFGAERRGAPVSAFVRADPNEITIRCGVRRPDWGIILDPQLLEDSALFGSMKKDGMILLNSSGWLKGLHRPEAERIFVVDAFAIAHRLRLGSASFPIVNSAMIGAFAKASGLIGLKGIIDAIQELVPSEKDKNAASAREAYERVKILNIQEDT